MEEVGFTTLRRVVPHTRPGRKTPGSSYVARRIWGIAKFTLRISLLSLCAVLSACHSRSSAPAPAVTFSKIPDADAGGPDKVGTIEGRVVGARKDQEIVLYARSEELWWVQPYTVHPFTRISHNSTWKNETHLGTEYAALLVDEDYSPPDTTETLPSPGGPIAAVAVIKGQGPGPPVASPKIVNFSGYEWVARTAGSYRGGSHNSFEPANVDVDKNGALHLRIVKIRNAWSSAEVRLTRSLGYGTYRFEVHDISQLEPSAIFSLFDWDGAGTEQNRREFDIEIGRWGYQVNDNAQYVVQPYYIPANIVRFNLPAGVTTHSFHWEPGQIAFSSFSGAQEIDHHVFTSGVPAPGQDSVRISLYVFGIGQVALKKENEVVVDKFEYLP